MFRLGTTVDLGSTQTPIDNTFVKTLYIGEYENPDILHNFHWYLSGLTPCTGETGSSGTSGTSGVSGDLYTTTSNSILTISAGSKTLIVEPDLSYVPGHTIVIGHSASNYMRGIVSSYNSTTGQLIAIISTVVGSGTYNTWGVGLTSVPGPSGSSGTSGTSGSSGLSGVDGTSGSSGISGVDGSSGTSGTSGSSGISGVDGTSGSSGTSGLSGVDGTPGSSGSSGTSGTSGSSGISGVDGSSGTSGTSGLSGDLFSTVSNSSLTLGTGIQFLIVERGLSYVTGQRVVVAYDSTNYMLGIVDSYDPQTGLLVVNSQLINGSGTYNEWSVGLAGISGEDGTSGTSGTSGSGGSSGSSGSSGTSGIAGTSGSSGTSGLSGVDGTPGSSGTSGTSGLEGVEGHLAIWRYSEVMNTSINPGVGFFTLDAPDWGVSPNYIAISDTGFTPNLDFITYLDSLQTGTIIKLIKKNDATVLKYLEIISLEPYELGFERYGVTQIAGTGADPMNGDEFRC